MNIGFIGAGKVGFSLGKYLAQDNTIIGYASRSFSSAREAACFTNSQAFGSMVDLCNACDLVFFTVPDGAIRSTWDEVLAQPGSHDALVDTCVAHCSGALSSDVFDQVAEFHVYPYSIHPLFAISSKQDSYKELKHAFFTLEGDPRRIDEMVELFKRLGNPTQIISASDKTRYHAAAALASNHVVALYRRSCEELMRCGFTLEGAEAALAPLFLGNAQHVATDGAIASLTGPAERGDTATIEKHLDTLDGSTKEVYKILNDTLLKLADEKRKQNRK